jgi:hypothetical protein
VEPRKFVTRFAVIKPDVPERSGHVAFLTGTLQLFMRAFVYRRLLTAGYSRSDNQASTNQNKDDPLIQFFSSAWPVFNRRLSFV